MSHFLFTLVILGYDKRYEITYYFTNHRTDNKKKFEHRKCLRV